MIDSSGLFALEPDVPLVVPEVNPYVLADYRNRNVIAVADSLTSQLLAALKPLIDQGTVAHRRHQYVISVRTGKKAVDALAGQSAKLLNGIPIDEDDFFGRQLAFNMLPLLPDREGSVRRERRIVDEVRKILQDDGVMISASVVQSPVFYGHAQMVSFEALRPLAAEEAREAFSAVKISYCQKRRITRRRWATLPAIHSSLLAVCIMITVCRNKFSSGQWRTTCVSAAR